MMGNKPSKSLYEYGQFQRVIMIINLITGAAIWAIAGLTKEELAPIEEYGSFINQMHAEVWAIPLCLGAALHLIGQVVNGDTRLRPWVTPLWRLIGAIVVFGVMAAFTYGGLYAPLALWTAVHFIQSLIFSIIAVWFVQMACSDFRHGLRKSREK